MSSPREHWGSKLGFIMAAAGSAIGLGSLWKFPYTIGENGGGIFVLIYLLFTFLLGVPIFIGELIIGRSSQKSPSGAYYNLSGHSPLWKHAGSIAVFTCFIVLSFYSVVTGWALNYFLMSLSQFSLGRTPDEIQGVFDILISSGDINLFWHFVAILICFAIVFGGIRKGIEFWSKILTPALLTILAMLLLYSSQLPGFSEAVSFIFTPDFNKFHPSSAIKALGLAFFTLSVGLGIILTYGSYMRKDEDIPKTALTIALMDITVSLAAALMIFPIIFTFNLEPQAGKGLIFQTLPILFEKLPGTLVISSVFFLLLVFTALTSSISILEVLVANLIETYDFSRRKAAIIAAIGVFIFGVPSALVGTNTLFSNWEAIYGKDFFVVISDLADTWLLPLNGLLACIFSSWVMKQDVVKNEFINGSKWAFLYKPWLFAMRFITPIAILLVILQESQLVNFDALISI
ncbi:MAG: sodium-dependent transporter [Chlamydiales bacterium]|nr:sodium-dependent transporter [Chlamydiales bacterium]